MDAAVSVSSEVYFLGSRMRQAQDIVQSAYDQLYFFIAQKNSYITSLNEMELNGKQK